MRSDKLKFGAMKCEFSDHDLTFASMKSKTAEPKEKHGTYAIRDLKQFQHKRFLENINNFCNFIHKGRSRLEDYIGHFASSLLPVNIIVNMLCFCFNCDFKLRWL